MKYTFLATLSSVMALTFLTGCSGQMTAMELSGDNTEEECQTIDKELIKIDQFLDVVNKNSAFHMEEIAQIGYAPNITASNNKPRMLKDANEKKVNLLAEREKLGCEPLEK